MISNIIEVLVGWVWYYPVVILCLFSGVYFTLRMGFIQIKSFPHAIALLRGRYDNPNETGQITHFQALSAALSGTIGLGNIAGVAIAIAMGGPGAILWMWLVGFLGMATKYVECTLGTHYREVSPDKKTVRGGPMYYILSGLGHRWRWLSVFYAVCVILAGFGSACMFQSNQAAAALASSFSIPFWLTGLALFVLTGSVIIGGIKRIGSVASKIVPLMCCIYVLGAILICLLNLDKIPLAFQVIITDAFTGSAAAGGAFGTVVIWGVRRAIFSNEAGLGSAAIAHAAVKTDYPVREGIVASVGPLIDTIIVCTATALVIVMSGLYGAGRYVPIGPVLHGFESVHEHSLAKHWSYGRHDVIDQDKLLARVTDGDYHLSYEHINSEHEGLLMGPFSSKHLDYRFAFKRNKGDFKIELLDANKSSLGFLTLNEDKSVLKSNTLSGLVDLPLMSLSHYADVNEWQSVLLHFSGSLSDLMPTTKLVYFLFHPVGDEVNWLFDRVEAVKSAPGITLTTLAFDHFFKGFGSYFISIAVFLFAFSTMITWSYYGETAVFFLLGNKFILPYKLLFVLLAFYGAIESLSVVVNFSDLMIGLLVIPNTVAIFMLLNQVKSWTHAYFKDLNQGKINTYK
eukprot:COSAG01_NODE_52_length_31456_cov_125.226648_13_plen_627_part_00